MKTLDDGWQWYQQAKFQVRLVRRLASKYWNDLPWEAKLEKDDRFKDLDQQELEEQTQFTLNKWTILQSLCSSLSSRARSGPDGLGNTLGGFAEIRRARGVASGCRRLDSTS